MTEITSFIPSKRQKAILDMVASDGFVATEAMVTEFDVTPQTIRRDLNELNEKGLLTRFHGGAGQPRSVENQPYFERLNSDVIAKRNIGKLAASLIPNGASLFINIGTTTECVAKALVNHKNLHVVTNNINVAQILSKNPTMRIMLAGGEVRNHDGGIVGASSVDFVNEFRLDFGVIGISGIDDEGNLLDFDHQEVKTARAILKNSRKSILVTDQSKFGRAAMNRMAHMADLDALVTDKDLTGHFKNICDVADVNVHIASNI